MHTNSSRDESVSTLAVNISGGNKRPVVLTPGAPVSKPLGGSKVDSAFHPSEADQMSTTNLVVKSKLTPDSGFAALRHFTSIDKKGVTKFFKYLQIAYMQGLQKILSVRNWEIPADFQLER